MDVRRSLTEEISAGIRWLSGAPLVLLLACIMGDLNLINAAMPLLAITVGQRLGVSDTSIGTMVACGGIGSVLGSICGTRWLRLHGFGRGVVLAASLRATAFDALFAATNLPRLGLFMG